MALYNRKEKLKKRCECCNDIFYVLPSRNYKRFCSISCFAKNGIKIGIIKPVLGGWNKGKKTPLSVRQKQSRAKLENPVRYWLGKKRFDMRNDKSFKKNNPNEYSKVHKWVYKNLADAGKCELCGSEKKLVWSNKNHLYKKDRKDWQRLCQRCHKRYDKEVLKIKV
jgi:hypothetical protein